LRNVALQYPNAICVDNLIASAYFYLLENEGYEKKECRRSFSWRCQSRYW